MERGITLCTSDSQKHSESKSCALGPRSSVVLWSASGGRLLRPSLSTALPLCWGKGRRERERRQEKKKGGIILTRQWRTWIACGSPVKRGRFQEWALIGKWNSLADQLCSFTPIHCHALTSTTHFAAAEMLQLVTCTHVYTDTHTPFRFHCVICTVRMNHTNLSASLTVDPSEIYIVMENSWWQTVVFMWCSTTCFAVSF